MFTIINCDFCTIIGFILTWALAIYITIKTIPSLWINKEWLFAWFWLLWNIDHCIQTIGVLQGSEEYSLQFWCITLIRLVVPYCCYASHEKAISAKKPFIEKVYTIISLLLFGLTFFLLHDWLVEVSEGFERAITDLENLI